MLKALGEKIIRMSGETWQPVFSPLGGLLVAASHVYRTGTALRHRLYQTGRIRKKRLSCQVISVGNIMAGGTGKTPLTIYLADMLAGSGKTPVVISRGYRGRLKQEAAVAGDGKKVFLGPDLAGDEPHMMARLKRFPVLVGKNRYRAGCLALEQFTPDVLLLDDGFQHIQLERDLDLVLMDHDHPLGNGRILPAGRLREPAAKALVRAHAVVLTRCPKRRPARSHPVSRLAPDLPVFYSRHQPFLAGVYPAGTVPLDRGGMADSGMFKGLDVMLFSGIANNRTFSRTIRDLGANIRGHLDFEDHYRYNKADILEIQARAGSVKAKMVVTTRKDWAKMDVQIPWPVDLAVADIRIVMEDEPRFHHFIRTRLNHDEQYPTP